MDEFLKTLEKSLKYVSRKEKDEILTDYREHFEDGVAAGKSEVEVAASLGDPAEIAKMYTAMGATTAAMQSRRLGDAMRMIGAIATYKLGGGLVMGSIYFAFLSALIILFAFAGALVIGAIGSIAYMGLMIANGTMIYSLMSLFLALVLGSGGLLGIVFTAWLWKVTIGRLPRLAHRMMNRGKETEK